MRNLLLAATAALAFAAPAAATTTYNFSLTGGSFTATWSMPASPTPDTVGFFDANFDNVTFTLPGNSTATYTFIIRQFVFGGGMKIVDPNMPFPALYDGYGPASFFGGEEIFTGTLSAPTFKTGSFNLTRFNGFSFDPDGTLTISDPSVAAVPEPASWAMLIAGFGLTGAALRRRRTGVVAA